jgi:AcrR family transcriptional regulator
MSSSTTLRRPYRMSARADAAAATRERMLTAAWTHFASRPYEDVRLREIAADATVSLPTLHNAFGAKEQLLTAAYAWWGLRVIAQRETAPVGDEHRAVCVLFDHYEAHGDAILRMLSQEERIPAIRQMTDAGRSYHREWVQRTFAPSLHDLRGKARQRRLNALVLATDLLAWKLLRRDMPLTREEAETTVLEIVRTMGACRTKPPKGQTA